MNKKHFYFLFVAALLFQNCNGMLRRVTSRLHGLKKNCGRGLRKLSAKPFNNSKSNTFVTHEELDKISRNVDILHRVVEKLAVNYADSSGNIRPIFDAELGALKGSIKNLQIRMARQERKMQDVELLRTYMFGLRERASLPEKHLSPVSKLTVLKKTEEAKKFIDLTVHELAHKAGKLLPNDLVKKHVVDEIKRLEDKELIASEKAEVRAYVKYVLDMPWQRYTIDEKDIKKARTILDEDHYGMAQVKDYILDEIAVKNVKHEGTMPIMCLVGQPGTGKTSIGKSIARALGRNYVRVALGGVGDESELRGHRKTYVGSRPGRLIQAIKNGGVANPVLLFDEIDKVGTHGRGDLSAALLEVLDPQQNKYLVDRYLEVPFDLSQVLFVVTANDWNNIAKPLQDRMEKIQISGYSVDEKLHIAQKYLWPNQLKDVGIAVDKLPLDSALMKYIIVNYADEPGVRQLDRCLRKLARKAVRTLQENGTLPKFNKEMITHYFGKSRIDDVNRHIL